ncbi:hypothetical protein IBL26_12920 [Roseomonas aerophila]|uniref:Uncharacterized protein n=1 Tax=Teichococcus aerophilus TaxID=1224513 RepID=A0ABR7RMB3_9PROT|nr:hypothetical protein [Pseudoroseomonas aerophila]MBC9207740.1 hypothetical protein [Pseudoroseomonas aerophila]
MGEANGEMWNDDIDDMEEADHAPGRRRQQVRRRALAAELRGEFDARLLAGEDILTLSRAFDIEPWYAQRRAKRVLSRASQDRQMSPFLSPLSEMEEDMTPLQYACGLLGPRVRPLRNGYYVLDGHEAGPKEVTRAANRVLRERGQSEIPYPGLNPLYR